MNKSFPIRKLRVFSLSLVIGLAFFLCILSGLDAPEYIRCTHVGVCEFLEICGELGSSQKLKILMDSLGKLSDKNPLSLIYSGQFSSLISLLNVVRITGSIQGMDLPKKLSIMGRCIQPSSQDDTYLPLVQDKDVFPFKRKTLTLSEGSSNSQALQLIITSFIRC